MGFCRDNSIISIECEGKVICFKIEYILIEKVIICIKYIIVFNNAARLENMSVGDGCGLSSVTQCRSAKLPERGIVVVPNVWARYNVNLKKIYGR